MDDILIECKDKMQKALDSFLIEISKIRGGTINKSIFDDIKVDYSGAQTPLNQLCNINTNEASSIILSPYDVSVADEIVKSIQKSDLGLNPQIDGQLIRLPVPELNEERRNELKKLIKSIGEKCKVSIRNIRREANDDLKKLLKSKQIGEDDEKIFEKKVQEITDKHIKSVDDKVALKEKEIMTIWTLWNMWPS